MKLVRADGNVRLQRALTHTYVRSLVTIFVQHQDILDIAADILQNCVYKAHPDLQDKLNSIAVMYRRVDMNGEYIVPEHIVKLIELLKKFYQQPNEVIEDQRGAIVERLGYEIVSSRYSQDECANSRRFVDEQGKDITLQEVDIAALSHRHQQLEAYECKMRANKLERDDCNDLEYLASAAYERGYRANIGIISFDPDSIVRKKLWRLGASNTIKVYGLESIRKLLRSPFE
jgi:hypothetical protein